MSWRAASSVDGLSALQKSCRISLYWVSDSCMYCSLAQALFSGRNLAQGSMSMARTFNAGALHIAHKPCQTARISKQPCLAYKSSHLCYKSGACWMHKSLQRQFHGVHILSVREHQDLKYGQESIPPATRRSLRTWVANLDTKEATAAPAADRVLIKFPVDACWCGWASHQSILHEDMQHEHPQRWARRCKRTEIQHGIVVSV